MYIKNRYVWPRKALKPKGRNMHYSTTAWSPLIGCQLIQSQYSVPKQKRSIHDVASIGKGATQGVFVNDVFSKILWGQ